jgi:IS30 family transposase
MIHRCDCALRASTKLSTRRIRASYDRRDSRRTAGHRYAPVEITAERTTDSSAGEAVSNNQCSPTTTGPSRPSTGQRPGHWEGDLIIGDDHLSAIGTLVERQTRMLRLVHLPRADSDSLHAALVARMQDLPPALMRSITRDQAEAELPDAWMSHEVMVSFLRIVETCCAALRLREHN